MNRPSTHHSSFQKPLMVSSTGGVTQTAAGLAAFGRRSAGGVPNVGSEAISKHQQNPPPHQQQQQHVDPGEQTSTEKEEEEEDVGLSYVHKEIQRDVILDEQPASRGGGVTDLMRTNSSSGPRRPTSQLGLLSSSSSSSQASIMQAPPYVFSSQSTSTFSQGDTLSEGSIPLNHHHHQIGNTSRERISSTVDQPFEFAPTAVKSRLVSSSSSASSSSSSSNWAVSGPVISGGPISSSSSSRGNRRNNHTGNGLASALASSAGLRLSKSSLETDQTSSYHHGVPLRTSSSSSSPLGDDNIEVQEEERGIGARVLTAGLPTSFLSPNAPRLRGETINPQESTLRSSSALTSSSSSINSSHAKNALRQQHQLQQEQEREDERKRENEPASSSFLGQERVEYDDLAGEAEPSVTPLPKPRGVLATTGATSRGGGGGRAVVAVGGVVSRNSNQEKSMRSRIRAPSDNQEDEEEGDPEGVHPTFVAPRGNLADNGHARVQLQENPSYPNGDDYAASSPSSHQDGVQHVDDQGGGRVRRKGAGAGQLASNNHHHRHLNNNKNNNNAPISSRNINITASEFQQQSGPVAITKLQEAQMRMRQQQQQQQQQPRGGGGGIDSTKIHYTNHQQQIHQRGAASGPIHPDDRSSYINVDIGGPRVAHTINDKLGNRSEQDQLAFSRKARPTHYTPKTLSEFKQANDALGIPNPTSSGGSPHGNRGGSGGGGGGGGVDTVGVRNRKSAPPGYYELGKLGPDLSNEDLLKIKAAKERQREYAAQVSTSAREKAAAAASASALNLAANIAAAQNHNSHHQNQSSPSSSSSLQSHSGSYSPDALSQHASIVMQQMHPSSMGGSAAPTSTSLPHAAVSSKRVSKDPAAIEKEKGAFLRERVKEYASRIPIPQPPKSLSVMSMPATSSSVTAAIPSLQQSDQVPLHGRRSIVLSGASERRSTSNGGGPLDPISNLEREHELHRQQADRIRADLFLD